MKKVINMGECVLRFRNMVCNFLSCYEISVPFNFLVCWWGRTLNFYLHGNDARKTSHEDTYVV